MHLKLLTRRLNFYFYSYGLQTHVEKKKKHCELLVFKSENKKLNFRLLKQSQNLKKFTLSH